MTGKHIAPKSKRTGWKRLLPTGVLGWVVAGVPLAALAVWYVITGISGTVNTADLDVTWSGTPTLVSGTCSGTLVNGKDLAITWDGVLGGDTCTLSEGVEAPNGNTVDVVAQSFDIASPGATGINATLGSYCGTTVTPGATVVVQFTLEVDEATTSPGDVFTFDPAVDSIHWVPASQYDPGACS